MAVAAPLQPVKKEKKRKKNEEEEEEFVDGGPVSMEGNREGEEEEKKEKGHFLPQIFNNRFCDFEGNYPFSTITSPNRPLNILFFFFF